MKVSNYIATNNEANFANPITTQVSGGTHITFELITKKDKIFYMTRWPKGLPRHDDPPNVLRFPHGLIRFGESLIDFSKRLVRDQLGMGVKSVKIAYWDSYLDSTNHWHIEPGLIVELKGTPRIPKDASEIVSFDIKNIPEMTFWPKNDFIEIIKEHLPEVFSKI